MSQFHEVTNSLNSRSHPFTLTPHLFSHVFVLWVDGRALSALLKPQNMRRPLVNAVKDVCGVNDGDAPLLGLLSSEYLIECDRRPPTHSFTVPVRRNSKNLIRISTSRSTVISSRRRTEKGLQSDRRICTRRVSPSESSCVCHSGLTPRRFKRNALRS